MPVKLKLMRALKKEYGLLKGKRVYYSMENMPKYKKLFK